MRKMLITLMATAVAAVAIPAVATAHPGEEAEYAVGDWNNGGASYADFTGEYQHIMAGIQHGLGDGSYNRSKANNFYRQLQQIRYRAYQQQVRGYYNPEETQNQLQRLHEQMHAAHERGHEWQEYYGGGSYRGYDGNAYRGFDQYNSPYRDDRYRPY